METVLIVALLGAIAFFMLTNTAPNPQPPQVILVQIDTPQDAGDGCLPIVLIGFIAFMFLRMIVG